ncbi:MAG: type IV secretion system DNA-binding domain-containing protein [Patescibacteria group bacterium]
MDKDNKINYFAETDSRGQKIPFGIKEEDRTRHVYVIGKTGMGKSTLLENMAIQDIKNGHGLAFVDPHGKTAEMLLDYVPAERVKDVVYFAPFDLEHPISFNIMEDIGPDKRHLVVSGLMSTFKKIWIDAWSARMEYILQNTLLALLEYPGATLLGVNRMLSDKDYRKKVVDNIKDPATKSFWVDEFAKYTERFAAEAVPAIQNKVGQFTSNPLIRNVIGQPKSSFDLRKILDEKKILIVNLSKGLVGEGNASLLGGMLITKIYLAAMSRADVSETKMKQLPNFYLYVDEFQSFANESFADILSEARKYKLNLTMAHQYVEQMAEEVQSAVFGNVGTMIVFRVGPLDAELFEKEFMPTFTAEDFVNLGKYQMYLKLMIDGVGSQPFSAVGMAPIERPAISFKERIIENSRQIYAQPRKVIEENIVIWHEPSKSGVSTSAKAKVKKEEKTPPRNEEPLIIKEEKKDIKETILPKEKTPRESKGNNSSKNQNIPLPPSIGVDEELKISVERLTHKNKAKLGPSEDHRKGLKEALMGLVKENSSNQKPKPAPNPSIQKQTSPTILEKSDPKFASNQSPKEVPEEVLKKLLDIN